MTTRSQPITYIVVNYHNPTGFLEPFKHFATTSPSVKGLDGLRKKKNRWPLRGVFHRE